MLLHYSYKLKKTIYTFGTGRECGPYQVSREDFKEFFSAMKKDIECIVVKLEDGRRFIGYWHKFKGFIWEKV